MEYGKIIAVTGLSGLFELVTSKSDGAIVRSLEDKTTRFVASRVHSFSHLESIEVYTSRENVNLAEVLLAIEKSDKPLPDAKDATALKAYFREVFPEMDQERVYTSDMKKMVRWFEQLKKNEIAIRVPDADEEPAAGENTSREEASASSGKSRDIGDEGSPAPAAGKKTAAKKQTAVQNGEEDTLAGPVKKPASKKKKPADSVNSKEAAEKEAPAEKAPAKKKSRE